MPPRKPWDKRKDHYRRYPGEPGYRAPSGRRGRAGRPDRNASNPENVTVPIPRTEADYMENRDAILARVGRGRRYSYAMENAVLAWESDPAERERARESRSRILERQHALMERAS